MNQFANCVQIDKSFNRKESQSPLKTERAKGDKKPISRSHLTSSFAIHMFPHAIFNFFIQLKFIKSHKFVFFSIFPSIAEKSILGGPKCIQFLPITEPVNSGILVNNGKKNFPAGC